MSFCDQNLDSISSHHFSQLQSLIAENSLEKFDIVCLFETCWNPETSWCNFNLQLLDYKLARADHPSYSKYRAVCLDQNNFCLWNFKHFVSLGMHKF